MILPVRRLVLVTGLAVVAAAAVPVGLFVRNLSSFRSQSCRVAVFMFHDLAPDSEAGTRYRTREADFAAQLDELAALGATTRPVDELLAVMDSPAGAACPFDRLEYLITFDLDGLSEHRSRVLPHLEARGLPALFFVPTGFLDHGRVVRSEDVTAMAQAGITFGSHTEGHEDLRLAPERELDRSLPRSRDTLQRLTGQPIATIAAPGGRYDERTIPMIRRAGFEAFFTSDPCYLTPGPTDRPLCRIEIRGDGFTMPQALTTHRRVAWQATEWWIKRRIEQIVGPRRWQRLRGGYLDPGDSEGETSP